MMAAKRFSALTDRRRGLSLLEVIIATVVLAVSAIMLVRVIGSADRNAQKAERRIGAQAVCQNRLNEILAGLMPLESSDALPDLYSPQWMCSVKVEDWQSDKADSPTDLVLVEVSAFYQPVDEFQSEVEMQQRQQPRADFVLRRIVRRRDSNEFGDPSLLGNMEAGNDP